MLQREVADRIGVDETTVFNRKANTASPEIRYMQAIIRFLGYKPLPAAETLAEQLVRQRTSLEMSQKMAAGWEAFSVEPSTLARRERGE
jgi:hypothetical protein